MQYMSMWHRLTRLLIPKQHNEQPSCQCAELRERVHRLEIAHRELTERTDSLEGRHASLSASVRGRLGGRGNRAPALSGDPPLSHVHP